MALQDLSVGLDKLIKKKRDAKSADERAELAGMIGVVVAGIVQPVVEEIKLEKEQMLQMAENTLQTAKQATQRASEDSTKMVEDVTRLIKQNQSGMIDAVKNIPAPKVDVKIPKIEMPKITVPKPEVTVNIPEIKAPKVVIPKIEVPEPKVTVNVPEQKLELPERFKADFDKVDRARPMPIMAVDAGGKPINFGGGATGGKSDFFTLKDIQTKSGSSIIDQDSSAIKTTTSALEDTPEFFEDTSFVTGDSPVTLDINTALGRNATKGFVTNDGAGNFTIAFSTDGSTFGDAITMKTGEVFEFADLSVDSIKITWVADSSYRVSVV